MATAQQQDPKVQAYRTTTLSRLQLEDVHFGTHGITLLCDISISSPRPIVLASWRCQVFDVMHGLSHPSVRRVQSSIMRLGVL